MSSFVIDMKSYVRVGAVVAGIAKANKFHKNNLWIYDYEKNRNMIGLDYVEKFVECYKLNVDSVCKQYGDNPDTYADKEIDSPAPYDDEYVRYFKYGEKIADDTLLLMDFVWNLIHFSRSVNYQIEDPVDNQIVMEWFNLVIAKITELADMQYDDREQWGQFDLELDKVSTL